MLLATGASVPTLPPLTAGEHSFVAEAVDAAGNVSDKTSAWDFTLAGDAPAAPAITQVLDDAGSVTGALQKGDVHQAAVAHRRYGQAGKKAVDRRRLRAVSSVDGCLGGCIRLRRTNRTAKPPVTHNLSDVSDPPAWVEQRMRPQAAGLDRPPRQRAALQNPVLRLKIVVGDLVLLEDLLEGDDAGVLLLDEELDARLVDAASR